jgi:hypothetical protein
VKNIKNPWIRGTMLMLFLGLGANASEQSTESSGEKRVNIQVDPLSLVNGSLYAFGDFVTAPGVTVGPTLNIFSAEVLGTKISVLGAGVRATYIFSGNSFQDGWFVAGHGRYGRATVQEGSQEGKGNIFSLSTLFGYGWYYESGLNFNLGAGAIYFASPESVESKNGTKLEVSSFRGFLPSIDFTMGWAF